MAQEQGMAGTSLPRLFVTGSTGQLGRLVVAELLKRVSADRIVAGVRSPDHVVARQFATQGIEVRVANYTQPDTLSTVFAGIDRLLLISSSSEGDRVAEHGNVITAAKAAGVGLLAYTSLLHADTSPLGLREDHQQTEALLKASGTPFVLLRHGWYMENHMASLPPALQYGAVLGCAGEGRFSTAARADFAEAAAVVLADDGHSGRTYELAGDEGYTLADFAATIAEMAGKPIAYRDMPHAAFRDALIDMGLPAHVADLVADADAGASRGGLEDKGHQLSALIGRPTTPLRQMVEQAMSA